MVVTRGVEGTRIRVDVTGDMDLGSAAPIREALDGLLTRHPDKDLVINLAGVTFIDSAGLAVLLGRYRRLEARGARLILVGASAPVHGILQVAGLTHLVRSSGTEPAAH
jgi:stage II sporulation protein AA (anti-sigma F factor antagonist)